MALASGDRATLLVLVAVWQAEDRIMQRINQVEANMLVEVQSLGDSLGNLETVAGQVKAKVDGLASQETVTQEDKDALTNYRARVENVIAELQTLVA